MMLNCGIYNVERDTLHQILLDSPNDLYNRIRHYLEKEGYKLVDCIIIIFSVGD